MTSFTVSAGARGVYAKTLGASTVDTVTFTDNVRSVEITKDTGAAIYVTLDGSTPTVGGDGTIEIPGGVVGRVRINAATPVDVVKLISSGTPTYSVVGDGEAHLTLGGGAGGSGSSGAVTIVDGGDVAQGTTTDASSASTVIGLLKNVKAALAGALAVTSTDGGQVTIGTTTDASSASTLVGLLKNIKAALAGALAVNATNVLKAAGAPTTQTTVAATTTSAALLASNGSAVYRQIVTDAAVTIKLGSGTVTDYNGILMPANSAWDGWIGDRLYTGALAVKTLTGTANVSVVEG